MSCIRAYALSASIRSGLNLFPGTWKRLLLLSESKNATSLYALLPMPEKTVLPSGPVTSMGLPLSMCLPTSLGGRDAGSNPVLLSRRAACFRFGGIIELRAPIIKYCRFCRQSRSALIHGLKSLITCPAIAQTVLFALAVLRVLALNRESMPGYQPCGLLKKWFHLIGQ